MSRAALVTGASRGIGRAIALRLARAGLDLAVNYNRGEPEAVQVVAAIAAMGRKGVAVCGDVSNRGECRRLVDRTIQEFGRLDVLVNNAGVYNRHTMNQMTEADWDLTIRTNLEGTFFVTCAALPHLKASKGCIVNVSSQLAFMGTPHGADYVASKAGLLGLTKAWAVEFAPFGIRVNAVAPGAVNTDILAVDSTPEAQERRRRSIPLGRVGEPEEVAAAVAFLCSGDARWITGATYHVNGGQTMV